MIRTAIVGLIALAGALGLASATTTAPAENHAAVAATAFTVDPVHSTSVFRIKHMNVAYFYGRFDKFGGTINFDESNPSASSAEIEVDTASVNSNNGKRDGHIKSKDFFNAAEFPTASFKSTSWKPAGENTFDVAGDLTLHGVTKPITVKFEKTGTGKSRSGGALVGFETTFTIKRSDYGISFMPEGLSDEVRLTFSIEAGST